MRKFWSLRNSFLPLLAAAALAAGCNRESTSGPPTEAELTEADSDHTDDAHAHAHPEHGPHGGDLIELGEEEYHAELMHEDGAVTIYLLGPEAKTAVPIDAKEVTINLRQNGAARQYKLAADPQAGEPEGRSSRFVGRESELVSALDAEDSSARLMVQIDGRGYSGVVEHDHDHQGHDHAD